MQDGRLQNRKVPVTRPRSRGIVSGWEILCAFTLIQKKNSIVLLVVACKRPLCCRDQRSTWDFCFSHECAEILMLVYYFLWFPVDGINQLFSLLVCNSAGKGPEEELWRCKSVCEWVSRPDTRTFQVSCPRYDVNLLDNQMSKSSHVLQCRSCAKKWLSFEH